MLKKFGFNCFYLIYAVLTIWIFAAGITAANGSGAGNVVMMCGFAVFFGAAAFAAVKCRPLSPKNHRIAACALMVFFYIAVTAFGIVTMTAPVSDLEVLIRAAKHWLDNGSIVDYSYYFTICKNTLGNCIFIYLMFKPLHAMGIDITGDFAESYGIAVNCLMIFIAVYCLYRLVVRIVKNTNLQLLFLFICCCYLPFYLWAHRYYSDTLSLPFLTFGILMYQKSRENSGKKQIIFSVLCGVSLWAGYLMRGGLAIALAAIVIFSAFSDGRMFAKTGLVVLAGFLSAMLCWNVYVNNNRWIDYSNKAQDDFPLTMWLMYGAHDQGNYSDDDVTLLKSYPDYQSRKLAAKEKLKEYYSQYTPASYLKFLHLKYGITYSSGMFDAQYYLNNQRHGNFTHYFLLDGMPFTPLFRYAANGLHFFTLLCAVFSGFINYRKKRWNIPMLMQIVLVGNIIFFSFWETKARYAFGVTPVLLLLAIYTLNELAQIADKNRISLTANKLLSRHKPIRTGG